LECKGSGLITTQAATAKAAVKLILKRLEGVTRVRFLTTRRG
jgi:hypothetical protein